MSTGAAKSISSKFSSQIVTVCRSGVKPATVGKAAPSPFQ